MASHGQTQQFEWALDRLRREFGAERVSVEVGDDGRRVAAEVRPPDGGDRRPYRVVLADPVLGDVNLVADPHAFLDAELGFARAWFEGRSKRFRTWG
jgi:hypothetical protein